MSDFVEQCRQEWRRLGVAEPVAEEMAADLASDLGDAEAEGISAEEFLGSSFVDPRAFAASWAAERGVIPVPPAVRNGRRRPFVLTAFAALAALVLVVAALLLVTGNPRLSINAHATRPQAEILPPPAAHQVLPGNASAPVEWILLFLALVALGFAAWLWANWDRSRPAAA